MFQAHWGQLQQALAAQGVILAPLNEPEHRGPAPLPAPAASFGDGQSHSQTGQGSGRRQSPYPEMMEETLPGRWTEAPPKPRSRGSVGPANGSLETWA